MVDRPLRLPQHDLLLANVPLLWQDVQMAVTRALSWHCLSRTLPRSAVKRNKNWTPRCAASSAWACEGGPLGGSAIREKQHTEAPVVEEVEVEKTVGFISK